MVTAWAAVALPMVTPPVEVVSIIVLPRATTVNGAAVDAATVETPKIYCAPLPPVEAADSPKVKAVLDAVVSAQFQTWALSLEAIVLPVVAAVMADKAEPVPLPQAWSVLLQTSF